MGRGLLRAFDLFRSIYTHTQAPARTYVHMYTCDVRGTCIMYVSVVRAAKAADKRIAVARCVWQFANVCGRHYRQHCHRRIGIGTRKSWPFFFFFTHIHIVYTYILFPISSPVSSYTFIRIYICLCVCIYAQTEPRRNDTGIDSFSPAYGTPGCCVYLALLPPPL